MSNLMWKSFNICFSKFKCFPTISLSPQPAAASATAAEDQDQQLPAATNPTLFKNFNSLYDANYSDDFSTSKSGPFSPSSTAAAAATEDFFSSSTDSDGDCIPDFSTAFASHRFFFSSPGSSNSIVEPLEPPPPQPRDPDAVVGGGVAVHTDSPDPYSDFRQSMVEMIEARDATADWEFLNELLSCYLSLNPGHTHKFIVGAFADVVVSLVAAPPPPPPSVDCCCGETLLQQRSATSDLPI
ncbi:transcription repressor OFP12-like [Salvia miltiorrhiza]|uniref:transcription repressor OFP12-like n=1 Tax=Salvia miltiorrhiza TaxID=226208 RepID=UPI0025ACAD92|nr:transcription repressor OFP12-like [Salvia miltiorrhiza]